MKKLFYWYFKFVKKIFFCKYFTLKTQLNRKKCRVKFKKSLYFLVLSLLLLTFATYALPRFCEQAFSLGDVDLIQCLVIINKHQNCTWDVYYMIQQIISSTRAVFSVQSTMAPSNCWRQTFSGFWLVIEQLRIRNIHIITISFWWCF